MNLMLQMCVAEKGECQAVEKGDTMSLAKLEFTCVLGLTSEQF